VSRLSGLQGQPPPREGMMSDVTPGGWFKVYYAEDSWIWSVPPNWLAIIFYILRKVRWKAGQHTLLLSSGEKVQVTQGSWFGAESLIADDLGVSKSSVNRTLGALEAEGFISRSKWGRKGTLYHVVNWATYQGSESQVNRKRVGSGSEAGRKRVVSEEGKTLRREEADRSLDSLRSSETSGPPTSSATEPPDHVVLELDLRNGTGHLRQSQFDVLQSAFPTVDVLQSCRSAMGWLATCIPSKRWTSAGMMRGLHRWCQRDHDDGKNLMRGSASSSPSRKPVSDTEWESEEARLAHVAAVERIWGDCK
jgi:hypothetical protein